MRTARKIAIAVFASQLVVVYFAMWLFRQEKLPLFDRVSLAMGSVVIMTPLLMTIGG